MPTIIKGGGTTNLMEVDANKQAFVNLGAYSPSNTSIASWTSSTALNTAVVLVNGLFNFSTLLLTLNQTSTIAAGAIVVEGSNDNSNYVALAGIQPGSAATVVTTYTLTASTYQTILYAIAGWQYVRIRLSTQITGSATVTVGYAVTQLTDANVVQPVAVSGTSAFNITQWAGGTLGTATNFGTTPGAVIVGQVNASIFSGTTALGAPATFGVSAPTGNALGVNASLFVGTTLATAATFGTTASGTGVLTNSSLFLGTTLARSNQTTTAAGVMDVNIVGSLGVTNSVSNGTFMAITDNTTKAGVIVGTTALKTDQSSQAGTAITVVPTAFGTGTPSGNAPGVQAALYVGTTPVRSNQATTATGAVDNNLVGIKGTTVVTAASGVQQVGVVGNAAATLDSTIGAATAPTNAVATSVVYQTTVPALTAGQAVAKQSDTTGATFVNIEGRKKTYSCYATFTAAAGVIAVLPGNASTTARVTRVEVSISTTGTAALETVSLIKTSAAPTSGTSAAMTAVPHDSGFAAAVSAPLSYTVAPTPGAAVGTIRGVQFNDGSASLPGSQTWLWEFGTRGGAAAIVLRGTAQTLEINLAAVVATQTAIVSFEWEEDNS